VGYTTTGLESSQTMLNNVGDYIIVCYIRSAVLLIISQIFSYHWMVYISSVQLNVD